MPRSIFETWIAPLDLEAFRAEYFSRRVLFREATRERLESVLSLRSWDVVDLVRSPRVRPFAWFQALDGRHEVAEVDRDAALKLYRSGVTLYLKHVPEVVAVASAIARALLVPQDRVRFTIFCNRAGATTRAHFDPVDTITLQLEGSKRWRVAANAFAPDPMVSWTTLDGSETHAELWLYAHDQLPPAIPSDREEYLLKPGAMLNVPRGFWHETDSNEESVSLHVHHAPLPWVDIALASLRSVLMRDSAWSEPPIGLFDQARAPENARALEPLLRSLVKATSTLPSLVASATSSRPLAGALSK